MSKACSFCRVATLSRALSRNTLGLSTRLFFDEKTVDIKRGSLGLLARSKALPPAPLPGTYKRVVSERRAPRLRVLSLVACFFLVPSPNKTKKEDVRRSGTVPLQASDSSAARFLTRSRRVPAAP